MKIGNVSKLFFLCLFKHSREITTLHFFDGKVHGLLFKVLDRENEPSCFQETLMKLLKPCLEQLSIKKKRIPVRITSVSAYVNVSYFLRFWHF